MVVSLTTDPPAQRRDREALRAPLPRRPPASPGRGPGWALPVLGAGLLALLAVDAAVQRLKATPLSRSSSA